MFVGYLEEITRHPVKSFSGEKVQETTVMSYGLYGDRSHAFLDEKRRGKFLTITQAPEMVRYKARFNGIESLAAYPNVEVITPDGKLLNWDDEALLGEMEQLAKRKVSRTQYTPMAVPLGAIEEEHIQFVTDASIQKLKELWGNDVDYRRFRPNLLFSLNEKIPFIEETWFGKRLKIGEEVELYVKRHCERCMIITVDPEDAKRDPALLKTVVQERKNHFGVYASVVKTGKIRAGDKVYLIE